MAISLSCFCQIKYPDIFTSLTLVAFLHGWASAQSPMQNSNPYLEVGAPLIRNYSPDEYGAHPQNWVTVQDQRGVLYFGNTNGILEFDGSKWRLIPVSNRSIVRALTIDADGRVYVGAIGEIGYLASNIDGNMQYVSLVDKIPEKHRQFGDIYLAFCNDHGVYFKGNNVMFYLVDEKIEVIQIPSKIDFDVKQVNNRLYVHLADADRKTNYNLYELVGNKLSQISLPSVLANKAMIMLLPYSDGQFFWLTSASEFCVFDPNLARDNPNKINSSVSCKRFQSEVEAYLKHNRAGLTGTTYRNKYVLNTVRGGVVIVDGEGRLIRVINKNRGLLDDTVFRVFVDRDENFWMAMNKGIAHVEISSPISKFAEESGLHSIVLNYARADGKLYVSDFTGVYMLKKHTLRTVDDRNEFVSIQNYPQADTFVIDEMFERIYAIPKAGSIFHIEEKQAYNASNQKMTMALCSAKSNKFPNHLFLGLVAQGLGVAEFYPDKSEVKKIIINADNYANIQDTIQFIFGDPNGDLWLVTYQKVYQVRFNSDSVEEFEIIQHDFKGLEIDSTQFYLFEGKPVIGTAQGLKKILFDLENRNRVIFEEAGTINKLKIEHYKEIRGFKGHTDGIYVVVTDSGFGILRRKDQSHYEYDGYSLKKIKGLAHRAYVEDNAVVWIGTNQGLYRYDPTVKKNYITEYQTLIREVRLGEDQVIFGGTFIDPKSKNNRFYQKKAFEQPAEQVHKIPYVKNNISFGFSATFYEQSSENRYSYRLVGFDESFSNWTDQSQKEYTNLPEGDYEFEVRAKNIFENQSKPARYRFSILSPWYRTTLAYIGYVGLFFGLMYVIIRINQRRLIAAKKKLEAIVAQRTEQVRKQRDQLELQNIEINKSYQKLKQTQNQLLDASWRAGMADVASNFLHNVGNALNSVFVSKSLIIDRMKRSKIGNLEKAMLVVKNPTDMEPKSDKGKKLVGYLSMLSEQLHKDHAINLEEIQKLDKSLVKVSSIVTAQQKYTEATGLKEEFTCDELVLMATEMSSLSKDDKIEIVYDFQYKQTLSVERHKVVQIIINLLHKAKKSLKQTNRADSRIQITSKSIEDERVQIEVSDNGIGMDADALSAIFTFEVADGQPGQDLDLHASANAAKSIGGNLSAISAGPNRGSTFILELPIK